MRMRMPVIVIVALVGSACASTHSETPHDALGAMLSHRVPFEIGDVVTTDGNGVTIDEVWGTRPAFEVGGTYFVKGTYKLAATDDGWLAFWQTAKGWDNSGPNMDTQVLSVRRGDGPFALLHTMAGPGYFHVVLHAGEGREVANVYFGHGETLLNKLKKKSG